VSDPLHIVHSEEQPQFAELRARYRADNQARIHRLLREDEIVLRAKDGTVVARKKTEYLTDAPPGHEHQRVDDWRAAGGVVPQFTSDFLISDSPGLARELRDLVRDAIAMREADCVAHPEMMIGAVPLASLDDAAVVEYLDRAKETNGPEATPCSDLNTGPSAAALETGSG
jgi:hypothetical protein